MCDQRSTLGTVKKCPKKLSIDEKLKLIERYERGDSVKKLVQGCKLSRAAFYGIIRTKKKIQYLKSQEIKSAEISETPLTEKHHELEIKLFKWYQQQCSQGVRVSDESLQSTAMNLASKLGLTDVSFITSAKWISRVGKCHEHHLPKTKPLDKEEDITIKDEPLNLFKYEDESSFKEDFDEGVRADPKQNAINFVSCDYQDVKTEVKSEDDIKKEDTVDKDLSLTFPNSSEDIDIKEERKDLDGVKDEVSCSDSSSLEGFETGGETLIGSPNPGLPFSLDMEEEPVIESCGGLYPAASNNQNHLLSCSHWALDVKDGKKRWTSLRDCHRKVLNRKKTVSGQKAVDIIPWKYENQMSFLKAHFNKKRPQISKLAAITENVMERENTAEGTSEDGTSCVVEQSFSNEISLELESSSVHGKEQPFSQELATPSTENIPIKNSTPSAKKKKISHETGSSAHEILKTYFENKKSKQDYLTSYFKGIEDTVRTFSPLLQIEIKSCISSLVTEYEYKNLTGSTISPYFPSPSPCSTPVKNEQSGNARHRKTPEQNVALRSQIASLREQGFTIAAIARVFRISRGTVRKWVRRNEEEGCLLDRYSGGCRRKTSQQEDHAIVQCAIENPDLTATDIARKLGVGVSISTVRHRLSDIGRHSVTAAEKTYRYEEKRLARLAFAETFQEKDLEFWRRIIFTDVKPKGLSSLAWGWCSYYGPGELVELDDVLTGKDYVRLLEEVLIPSVRAMVLPEPETITVIHKPSSFYRSFAVRDWQDKHPELEFHDVLPKGRDLNPLETLWEVMAKKHCRADRHKAKRELFNQDLETWEKIRRSPSICQDLVDSLPENIQKCLKKEGNF